MMTNKINSFFQAGLIGLIFGLTACGTTTSVSTPTGAATGSSASAEIEAALPLVRTGASVATGAVLDFAVKESSTRTRLANEMYAAANAVYSLSGGTFPTPAQFQAGILAFGGPQADANYAQFSTAIALHVFARPVDFGPGDGSVIDGRPTPDTGRIADLSPGAANALGLRTDSLVTSELVL